MTFPPDGAGVMPLPSGALVRGRRITDTPATPADLTLLLADGPVPPWASRRLDWPDFRVPADRDDAVAALRDAHARAVAGQRVEACCRGGRGRTGTALAALVVLDGASVTQAVEWVRSRYHPRAVETPWQKRWLNNLR